MNEWITNPSDDDQPRPASAASFIDMSDMARGRLERMGGDLGRVIGAYAKAAGPQLAQVTTPVSLKRGVLRVQCASASWAQSLTFVQAQLLQQLAAELPGVQITSIRAVVGARPAAPRPAEAIAPAPPRAPLDPSPLDEATDAGLRRAAEAIDDPDLRARVLAAARTATRRTRARRDPRS